jgi:mono/diheme cytochrome c family protein
MSMLEAVSGRERPSLERSAPRWPAVLLLLPLLSSVPARAAEEEPETASEALENPVPVTEETLARGRILYLRHCQTCHGYDGRALENIDFEATDLTAPSRWRFGTSDGDIFRTTRNGAALEMPPFRSQMRDEEIWHVVNYVRSLWPEDAIRKAASDGPGETEGER